MKLIEITQGTHGVELDLTYATKNNFTGAPVYKRKCCFLRKEAEVCLIKATKSAESLGLNIRIFDAFRPTEAQWVLWNHTPDPNFLADPRRGSPHSRGIAIDLTLIDKTGRNLEMGTDFDTFHPRSHHGNVDVSAEAQHNRHLLMGIMTLAGWDFYKNEWWHYQLFNSHEYPLLSDSVLVEGIMPTGSENWK